MNQERPELPVAYELIELDSTDSVMEEAVRRADQGAGEGTVIWAREQTNAVSRRGNAWYSPCGNLHCAIIVEPDYDNTTAEQLLYVAAVSAGTAIADLLEPMIGLRYRWPNHIYINELKSSMLQLGASHEPRERYPWLAIGLHVNVAEHPPNPEPECFNSMHASGTPGARVEVLLETYCRHFLSWINLWADEGFAPVSKAWVQRTDGIGEDVVLHIDGSELAGILREPDSQGRGIVEMPDGSRRIVRLSEYFSLGPRGT